MRKGAPLSVLSFRTPDYTRWGARTYVNAAQAQWVRECLRGRVRFRTMVSTGPRKYARFRRPPITA
jgi:hypothetical protein